MSTCSAYCAKCKRNTIHHDQEGWKMTCVNEGEIDRSSLTWPDGPDYRGVPDLICGNVSAEPPMYERITCHCGRLILDSKCRDHGEVEGTRELVKA